MDIGLNVIQINLPVSSIHISDVHPIIEGCSMIREIVESTITDSATLISYTFQYKCNIKVRFHADQTLANTTVYLGCFYVYELPIDCRFCRIISNFMVPGEIKLIFFIHL